MMIIDNLQRGGRRLQGLSQLHKIFNHVFFPYGGLASHSIHFCLLGLRFLSAALSTISSNPPFYRRNSSIQLKLDSLSTECAWDYLYIYDGRSIYDPQIAALR